MIFIILVSDYYQHASSNTSKIIPSSLMKVRSFQNVGLKSGDIEFHRGHRSFAFVMFPYRIKATVTFAGALVSGRNEVSGE